MRAYYRATRTPHVSPRLRSSAHLSMKSANHGLGARVCVRVSARPAPHRGGIRYCTSLSYCCSKLLQRGDRIWPLWMDETAVCTDIALELLKWSFMSSNDIIIDAVRASKTFRSVNKTFRDAFDNDKTGCKLLSQYTSAVLKSERRRIQGIKLLLKFHKRNQVHTHNSNKAVEWVEKLAESHKRYVNNHMVFLRALMYVVEGIIGDMTIMHRTMLSPHCREHLSRTCNGLPKGAWSLCPSEIRKLRVAPVGTTKWAESVLLSINSRDDYDRRFGKGWEQVLVKHMLKIKQEGPYGNKQHDEVLDQSLSDALRGFWFNS